MRGRLGTRRLLLNVGGAAVYGSGLLARGRVSDLVYRREYRLWRGNVLCHVPLRGRLGSRGLMNIGGAAITRNGGMLFDWGRLYGLGCRRVYRLWRGNVLCDDVSLGRSESRRLMMNDGGAVVDRGRLWGVPVIPPMVAVASDTE